jgi:hypothetical protein
MKHTESCWESCITLNTLNLFSLYIYKGILFVKYKVNCKINGHNTFSFDCHQCVQNMNLASITVGQLLHKVPAHINQTRDNSPL